MDPEGKATFESFLAVDHLKLLSFDLLTVSRDTTKKKRTFHFVKII